MSSGNQHRRSANRNWDTNSPPYGYGGLRADTIVLPVRIIMSPTSSSRFFVGRNARSATLRTILTRPLLREFGQDPTVLSRDNTTGGSRALPNGNRTAPQPARSRSGLW